jgi:tetratricopeptide (TPR) repeat protein
MRLARTLIACALSAALAAGGLPASSAPASTTVAVGTTKDLSHIQFHGAQPRAARREGRDLVLRFGPIAPPDISLLRVSPPPFLKGAVLQPVKGGLDLRLTLAEGADARLGRDGGDVFVNLAPVAQVATPIAAQHPDQKPQTRADPTPASGVVKMVPEMQNGILLLHFGWRAPLGAAVFRRGEAIWMVFDAPGKIDLSQAPRGLRQMGRIAQVGGAVAAVRIVAPPDMVASANAEGGLWTLAIGPAIVGAQPAAVRLTRDDAGPAALTAQMAGATGVFWLNDPVVGDRFAAVTALAPAKGLPGRRAFIDLTLLASSQGLAVEPQAGDLAIAAEGDLVTISRPKGLALSPSSMQAKLAPAAAGLPTAAALPALVDFDNWSKTGEAGFAKRYDQVLDAAAAEAAKGRAGGVQARMALARFLIGSELSYEAIGALDMAAKAEPRLMGDPEFRGLRGAARAMSGRYKEAQADFSVPILAEDPASALWRGYIAQQLGDSAGARQEFASGRSALQMFALKWRTRLARADAESALAVGDLPAARAALSAAGSGRLDAVESQGLSLTRARLEQAQGHAAQALALYDQVAQSDYGALAAPALLRATQIRLDSGKLTAPQAAQTLDSLRFRWRGDATELDTIRMLGRIYMSQGRYREALEALRSAGQRLPDLPQAAAISSDLASTFKLLFLNGGADGWQPIQALALFYDFKEFVPIGAEGDFMVRKLARRLVDVDLLDQAADLLNYQAFNRLDGVPRAEVATDLAMIQLMNKKPEKALQALNSSRTTLLPTALNAERRLLEARALMGLGRYDHALEVLATDKSPEAREMRTDVAWKQKDWAAAAGGLEALLGDRWKSAEPLSAAEEVRLLRAGVAMSLAGDGAGLTRLRTRYAKLTPSVRSPEAMQVALSGGDVQMLTPADYSRAVSDTDLFTGWVARMKQRFRQKPPPVTTAKPAQQAANPAPAKG